MTATKRLSGLDLLKIISMGMIIMHHMLTHGGLLFAFPEGSTTEMAVQLLNMFLFCSANVYALISGYVLSKSNFRLSRLAELWLQVFFTGVVITAGFALFSSVPVSPQDWLRALLPVIKDEYWYFTAYFGVYLLMPAMNHLLHSLTKRMLGCVLAALLFLFSIVPLFGVNNTLSLGGGYHIGWILVLYLLGGWIRLYGCEHLRKIALPVYVVCVILAWLIKPLQQYVSPAMLLSAVALLVLFENLHLSKRLQSLSFTLAPLTFGVYLLHDHPLVREHLMKMRFAALNQFSPFKLIVVFLSCHLLLYAGCFIIEAFRAKLFELFRVRCLCRCLQDHLQRFIA